MQPTTHDVLLNSTGKFFTEIANSTQRLLATTLEQTRNITNKHGDDFDADGNHFLSQKRKFMLMIGGWLLTAIFLFGVVFMVVTHFLGRRQWRKYQERLNAERDVNHIFVDPKFMKYTKRGWKEIIYHM